MYTCNSGNEVFIYIFIASALCYWICFSANWTPKFDGDVRPRAGLVFVEPKVYTEFLKEEAQLRQQTAMMARSRSTNINTLDDDATVLETVESWRIEIIY